MATCRHGRAAFSGPEKQGDAALAFDGDKSPAESADKSAHSKARGGGASRAGVHSWFKKMNTERLKEVLVQARHVNLLRRNIPARDVLAACFAEWKKSSAPTRARPGRWAKAQAVVDAENALPPRERDPVRTYQTICQILKIG